MTALSTLREDLASFADPKRALQLASFFQTAAGGYGEGDRFLGIRMPQQREVVGRHWDAVSMEEAEQLLRSPIHEERMTALLVLVKKYAKATTVDQKAIYQIYLRNTEHINNWDLVDASAEHIVGPYLKDRSKKPLEKLAGSPNLWERRIAMLSTLHYIKANEFDTALNIATMLVHDRHDLIQKAVGWMLREIGKRDLDCERRFLDEHCRVMPRTALRYAIERFAPELRAAYLSGTVERK